MVVGGLVGVQSEGRSEDEAKDGWMDGWMALSPLYAFLRARGPRSGTPHSLRFSGRG